MRNEQAAASLNTSQQTDTDTRVDDRRQSIGTQLPIRQAVVTEADAAKYIGLSAAYLQATRIGRSKGGPPFIRIGRRTIRYRIADLDCWLESRLQGNEDRKRRR